MKLTLMILKRIVKQLFSLKKTHQYTEEHNSFPKSQNIEI